MSPSTARVDLVRKLPKYAAAEIPHAWVVNPAVRTLEVFRRAGAHWTLVASHSDEDRVRAEPFEEIELALALLWTSDGG